MIAHSLKSIVRLQMPFNKKAYMKQYRIEHPTYSSDYYHKHKEWYQAYHQQDKQKTRLRALEMLGGAICVYCGCDDIRVLEINHKNGGGCKEWTGHHSLVYEIVAGRRPTNDLEVVCRICNAWHYISLRHPEIAKEYSIQWKRQATVSSS